MKNNPESFLWVEKYRPHSVNDCILPKRIKSILLSYVESGEIENYIAVGEPGCGKTSSAKALIEEMGLQYLFINASTEGNIDTIRHKVTKFANTKSMVSNYKVIVLDECDYLTQNAQAALRGIIEEYYQNCRFILTANYENRIMDALKSRCPVIDFNFNKAEKKEMMTHFFPRILSILDENNIEYDKKSVLAFCLSRFPDFRKTIQLLQRNTKNGKFNLEFTGSDSDEKIDSLINSIKERNFDEVREWIIENLDNDGHIVRRALYTKMMPLLDDMSIIGLIFILNEYDRYEVQVKDKELHMIAMCLQIMKDCVFKE